jgi:hypothetical protein
MAVFSREIKNLDSSIKSIRKGKFIAALVDEDKQKDENWVVNLRALPETPETRYTLQLLASNDFQESYKNYKDLSMLSGRIDTWLDDLTTYEDMIELRRVHQEPLLPVVEEEFKVIDGRINLRLEQRNNLAGKLKSMLIAPRPEYLATSDERQAQEVLSALENRIAANPEAVDADLRRRVKRLRGILLWRVRSEYDQRLTDTYNNLIALDDVIVVLKKKYNSFVRSRQAATQSYEGYKIPIRKLKTNLSAAQKKLKSVTAKQGRFLETMAINELDLRRKRLEEYQIKARFALAESYDRATTSQVDAEVVRQKKIREEAKIKKDAVKNVEQGNGGISENQSDVDESLSEKNSSIENNNRPMTFKEKLLER